MGTTTEKLGLGEDNVPVTPTKSHDHKEAHEEVEKLKKETFPADSFDPEHFPGLAD